MNNTTTGRGTTSGTRPSAIDAICTDRGGGALCNDPNGLCLGSRGEIDTSHSGVYTSLARLASRLSSEDGIRENQDLPSISVETDKAALLVKEYDGHTVVLRVPVSSSTDSEMLRNGNREFGGGGGGGDAGSSSSGASVDVGRNK